MTREYVEPITPGGQRALMTLDKYGHADQRLADLLADLADYCLEQSISWADVTGIAGARAKARHRAARQRAHTAATAEVQQALRTIARAAAEADPFAGLPT